MKQLIKIQTTLKATKNQLNKFGGYSYRSCEDILEAVKPLLHELDCSLILEDEIITVEMPFDISETQIDNRSNKENRKTVKANGRVYIKATATLYDNDGKKIASASAMAREEETKKGMDSSQLTGATSSYARKYALSGLFCIDDNKDADYTNQHGKEHENTKNSEPTPAQKLTDLCKRNGLIQEQIKAFAQHCGISSKSSPTQINNVINNFESYLKKYMDAAA